MRVEKHIAVVVPAFDEERIIGRMLARLPGWVDSVVVVDDGSSDRTLERARESGDARITIVRHSRNRGVGAAIVSGAYRAFSAGADVVAVMAGDDQMDPSDLASVIEPVLTGGADYVKGNRFLHAERRNMPRLRRMAGRVLSVVTRLATGIRVGDAQCGYAALSAEAGARVPLDELWPRYGYPNDLLGLLAAHGMRIVEVPVRPVYADEESGVRPWHVLVVLGVILRRLWKTRTRVHSARFGRPLPARGRGSLAVDRA